jgi:serine phosphatase RsbU (regulator of sigma subunit)
VVEKRLDGFSGALISEKDECFIWTEAGQLLYFDIPSQTIIGDFHPMQGSANVNNIIEFNGKIYAIILDKVYEWNSMEFIQIHTHLEAITGIGSSYDDLLISSHGKLYNLRDTNYLADLGDDVVIKNIITSRNRSFVWLSTNKGVFYLNTITGEQHLNITSSDGLPGNEIVDNGLYIDQTGILWILTYHGISNYNIRSLTNVRYAPKCYLSEIQVNGEVVDSTKNVFAHNENDFVFKLSGLFFSNEKSIEYAYYLRGEKSNSNFIRFTKENTLYYDNLAPGNYELVYRAKGEDDIWSESKSYKFTVKKAFWNTWGFRIAAVLIILLIIIVVYRWRLSRIRKQKEHLEALVQERTEDLVEANNLVTQKNEEITSSIHYAERIQQSLLPKTRLFTKSFADHFVIFMPRDIVSGDFFWAYERGDRVYISAVDCTGHGVPGAFMSMLGMSFLKEIVTRYQKARPGQMLNDLRSEIIRALQQEGRLNEAKDGMDMSLVSYQTKTKMLEFAGANNPVYIIRSQGDTLEVNPNDKLRKRTDIIHELQPNKMPIAIYEIMDEYDTVEVQLQTGDLVYLFSDGFPDQFGGPKNKKIMYKRLRDTLEQNHHLPMDRQKEILLKLFHEWKGTEDQVDDVTLIGFKV